MSLSPGTALGPYEILAPVGQGGMGEVYRARDSRLGRDVAIKILPASLAADPAAVERFEQEARAVAALSHPNILAIHDVGRANGVTFAVTELLAGETLRDRGRPPLRKALDYALQIAQGLAAAHAKGITHRDIKPENVFATTDGHIKILDFGLAKFDLPAGSDLTTAAAPRTDPGTVLGTVGYLAPEQALGKPTDARSDIFSFGVVLYELTTGARAFTGASTIDTLHRLIHDDPAPIDVTNPGAPSEVRRIIAKCLAKDPDDRYQSTRDLVVDLRAAIRVLDASPSSNVVPPPPMSAARVAGPRRAGVGLVGIAAVLVLGGAGGLFWWRAHREPGEASRPSAPLTIERLTSLGTVIDAAISPDGKYVAYVASENAQQSLWLRQLATASTLQLLPPGPVGFWGVTFSPDGSAIYYAVFTIDEPRRALFKVPSIGGTPRKLLSGIDSKPSFSPDGRQMAFLRGEFPATDSSSLMVADADGGNIRTLATRHVPDLFVPIFFTAPAWSPDGATIICPIVHRAANQTGTLVALRATDGADAPLPHYDFDVIGQAGWTPDGRALISVASAGPESHPQLWRLDARIANRRQITSDLLDYRSVSMAADASALVTVAAEATASIWRVPLDAGAVPTRISAGRYDGVSGVASAPGSRILFRSVDGDRSSLWTMDEDGTHRLQLVTEGGPGWPVATPDGRSAIYQRAGSGLSEVGLDGQGARPVAGTDAGERPTVTPDGKWIVYASWASGIPKLWKAPVAGGTPVEMLDSYAYRPAVSPDGTKVAFFYRERPDSPFVLAVMPIDGARPTQTFEIAPSVAYAAVRWTADGQGLLHDCGLTDRANIWLQPLAGGPARPVTHFADQVVFAFDRSLDGKSLLIARGVLSRDALLIRHFQ